MNNGVALPASGTDETVQKDDQASVFTPVSASGRIDIMDVLRGFALIGILLMNVEWFNRPIAQIMEFDETLRGIDHAVNWLVKVFVEGKFYKLFSLLFGMGFAVMLFRAREAGRPFAGWLTRRMLVLYTFGILHMVFLWGGDILHDYAISGLLLLGWIGLLRLKWLRRFDNPKSFLRIGLGFLLAPILVTVFAGTYFGATHDFQTLGNDWEKRKQVIALYENKKADPEQVAAMQGKIESEKADQLKGEDSESQIDESELTDAERIEKSAEDMFKSHVQHQQEIDSETDAFTQNSYWSATNYRAEMTASWLPKTIPMDFIILLPLFMIGYWFVASGVLQDPKKYRILFASMMYIGLGVGIVLNIGGSILIVHPAAEQLPQMQFVGFSIFHFGQYFLAAGYVGLLVHLSQKAWFKGVQQWLAPMGRMALTNYILHSLILTTIFYGYAMGMFGNILRGQQMLLVVAIILGQAALSDIWLQKFRFGPLEWLWRSFTYMRIQPMRL